METVSSMAWMIVMIITKHNWSSGLANDYDSDGCHDSDEDIDDDSDGILDEFDACPRSSIQPNLDIFTENDHDGDGCDNNDDDADDDNDGINDVDERARNSIAVPAEKPDGLPIPPLTKMATVAWIKRRP